MGCASSAPVPSEIFDVASLPNRLQLCGRSWLADELNRHWTFEGARDVEGRAPVVADPRPGAPCPAGACTDLAISTVGCNTVIFVRVGEDAYVDYSLVGGP